MNIIHYAVLIMPMALEVMRLNVAVFNVSCNSGHYAVMTKRQFFVQ